MNKNYKWWAIALLWVICFFNYADRQAFFAIFPALQSEFGLSAVQLGLLGSAFAWTYAAAAPLAGFIGDRFPRKNLILGGCFFWSAATILTGSCSRMWQFVSVRALTGFGESFYFPAAMSLISDYHGKSTRSLAMSLHQSAVYIGSIGGSWLGAWLAERHGWRVGFYFFGVIGLVLSVAFWRLLVEPSRGATQAPRQSGLASAGGERLGVGETLRVIFSKPTALLLLAVFLCTNFVGTIFLSWTPFFLVEKFHMGMASAGLSGALYINLASAVSVPLGGLMADRLASRFAGGRVLVQASGLIIGSVFVAMLGLASSLPLMIFAMTCYGFCKGIYDSNIFASLYDVIEPRARATAAGIMNTVGWGGGALGPLAVGFATQYGRHGQDKIANMSEAIAVGSVIYIFAAGLLLLVAFFTIRRDMVDSV